jgi:PadR family transcriptional regulator, regulatory protein PadR
MTEVKGVKGQVLKGHLELLLLAAVGAGPAHGYAIVEQLRERSGGTFDLAEGTVYPALHRLEQAGLLRSRWSAVSGRRRRVYELTPRGRARLEAQQRDWWQFSRAVSAVLGTAT